MTTSSSVTKGVFWELEGTISHDWPSLSSSSDLIWCLKERNYQHTSQGISHWLISQPSGGYPTNHFEDMTHKLPLSQVAMGLASARPFLETPLMNVIFSWIIWGFRCHFRGLRCLTIWFIPLFLRLRLVSLVLRDFADFHFVSEVMWVEWRFLRPCWSQKIAKEA